MTRLVTPCATPVSTTNSGRMCRAVHHTARERVIPASLYHPSVPRRVPGSSCATQATIFAQPRAGSGLSAR